MKTTRDKWTNKFDFLFITIGSAVGLGNVWRFPYLCYKNGGGAFMIPYFVTLFLIALPQLILQTSLGQLTSRSATKAWSIVPVMKGVGYAATYYAYASNITYATILAWAMRFLYGSFSSVLPWMTCDNPWNTENCVVPHSLIHNGTAMLSMESENGTFTVNKTVSSSTTEFWERSVLNISSGLTEVGSFQRDICICLVITWVISFLCMFRGVNWTSKVTYITAPLPIILLFGLLIHGLTLDGAGDGIKYFLAPNMTLLLRPQVWKDAALQNLFSLSLGSGAMIALGSFNKKNHNFLKDCLILSGVNSGASILSGLAVFSTLGYMAKQQNTTVKNVAEAGPGLAFTAYPEAVGMMPVPQLWSAIFFLMFFLLGLDTLFVSVEALVAATVDLVPTFFEKRWKKSLLNLALSASLLLLGLPTVTQNGMYYIYLLDNFSSTSWAMLFGIACECIAITWIYGSEKYYDEFCNVLGYRPSLPWFKYCWKYIIPCVSLILFVYCLVLYQPLVYNRTYEYPGWAIAVGWMISMAGFLWIPGYAIYYFVQKYCLRSAELPIYEIEHLKKEESDQEASMF